MTAQQVFKFYRSYKLFFTTSFDFRKYAGHIKIPSVSQQPECHYYQKIADKLQDAQIHALFMHHFFFNPNAFISDFANRDGFRVALKLASRAENGSTLLTDELWSLRKRIAPQWESWFYGDLYGTQRTMPACLTEVIAQQLPLDLASLVLLIPQTSYQFTWRTWHHEHSSVLVNEWIDRLYKFDRVLAIARSGWRVMAHSLAREFWIDLSGMTQTPQFIPVPQPRTALALV